MCVVVCCVCGVCSLSECVLYSVRAASMDVLCALYMYHMADVGVSCEHCIWRMCLV